MPSFKHRLIDKRLTSKFLFIVRNNNDIYYDLYHDGERVLETKLSHQSRNTDVNKSLVGSMAKQMGLSGKQFQDAMQCRLSRDDYMKVLAEKGLLQHKP